MGEAHRQMENAPSTPPRNPRAVMEGLGASKASVPTSSPGISSSPKAIFALAHHTLSPPATPPLLLSLALASFLAIDPTPILFHFKEPFHLPRWTSTSHRHSPQD